MSVIFHPPYGLGRLGNALFRYMATILLCNKYDLSYNSLYYNKEHTTLNDDTFEKIFVYNQSIDIKGPILLNEFYQFDIYIDHKNEIIEFMNKYKDNHYIKTDRKDNHNTYKISDIINNNNVPIYNTVLHIRLEDFVTANELINVYYIIELLKTINIDELNNMAIVVNKITTQFELNYINTLTNWLKENNINYNIESNDIITDFQIMKQCINFISSKSTLAWCASILSSSINKCYFPNYKKTRYQQFNRPHTNTLYYNIGE
jgi:hypothetical protein